MSTKVLIEDTIFCRAVILRCVQTDATTPNIVAPTILRVVARVLAVVCKRMQQLPASLRPAVHRGKNTTHISVCNPCVMSVRGPNIVALRFGDHGTKEILGVVD